MKTKDILIDALLILQNNSLQEKLSLPSEEMFLNQSEELDLRKLLKGLNQVYTEVCLAYFPLVKVENVNVVDGEFALSDLTKTILDIISIQDSNGNHVKYTQKLGGINMSSETRTAEITYTYFPPKLGLEDEIIMPTAKFVQDTLVFGTVAEYYLLVEDFLRANVWRDKFEDGIKNACRTSGKITLTERRWE